MTTYEQLEQQAQSYQRRIKLRIGMKKGYRDLEVRLQEIRLKQLTFQRVPAGTSKAAH